MKRLTRISFIVAVVAALGLLASNAGAEDLKLGYANLQRALNESEAGLKAKDALKEQAQKLEAELTERQRELKVLKEEIDNKAGVWNEETRAQKEQVLQEKSEDFQQRYMRYGDELNKKKQQIESAIINELRGVVREIAEKEGYSYVFEQSVGGLLYAPEGADLTDRVIEIYNKRNGGSE